MWTAKLKAALHLRFLLTASEARYLVIQGLVKQGIPEQIATDKVDELLNR